MAELLGMSERRGGGGGRGGARRRRRARSGREQRRGRKPWESERRREEGRGDARGAQGRLQQRQASRRWPDACSRAPATRSSSWRGGRRQGGAPGGLGRPATVLGRLVALGKFSLLCFISVLFSYSAILFLDLEKY